MKKLLTVAALTLLLSGISGEARANGWFRPFKIQMGANAYFRIVPITPGGSGGYGGAPAMQLGPWYHYWPLEAHFQYPAPMAQYPYWGGNQVLPPNFTGQGYSNYSSGYGGGYANYPYYGSSQQGYTVPAMPAKDTTETKTND